MNSLFLHHPPKLLISCSHYMFTAGNCSSTACVFFIKESRLKMTLLPGTLPVWWQREKSNCRTSDYAFRCCSAVSQVTCIHMSLTKVSHKTKPASVRWRCNHLTRTTTAADHIAVARNRTFLDGALFAVSSSSVFYFWWLLDFTAVRTFFFIFLLGYIWRR